MDDDLVQLVWDRAGSICEYCLLPQEYIYLTFELDRILDASDFHILDGGVVFYL